MHNPSLEIYSNPREDLAEFLDRCKEVLLKQRWCKLKQVQIRLMRRLQWLGQYLVRGRDSEEEDQERITWRVAQFRNVFSRVFEDLNHWVMRGDYRPLGPDDLGWEIEDDPDWQERLGSLGKEFITQYNQVHRCLEKANWRLSLGESCGSEVISHTSQT